MDDMSTGARSAAPAAKLLRAVPLKLRVAGASLAVLGAGALLAPQPTRSGVPASQERPVALLYLQHQNDRFFAVAGEPR